MGLLLDKHLFPFFVIQVDENAPQQQSSAIVPTPDDNGSLSATATTTASARNDDRASPLNQHTLRKKERQN